MEITVKIRYDLTAWGVHSLKKKKKRYIFQDIIYIIHVGRYAGISKCLYTTCYIYIFYIQHAIYIYIY